MEIWMILRVLHCSSCCPAEPSSSSWRIGSPMKNDCYRFWGAWLSSYSTWLENPQTKWMFAKFASGKIIYILCKHHISNTILFHMDLPYSIYISIILTMENHVNILGNPHGNHRITEKHRLTSVGSGIWQFGDEGLTWKEQYLQCGAPQL